MPILAQTLHGYAEGHRLLASSEGLDEAELALLLRTSDLSGYLPSGVTFDRYYTGFACHRYYALACTWLDTEARRAGTVFTHTLLIPKHEVDALDDPWRLVALLRKPTSAQELDPYKLLLKLPEWPPRPSLSLKTDEIAGANTLFFGTADRPILWVDEAQPEPIVRLLWELLRPEHRFTFSFCTFALQPRSIQGRPFEFLGVPPAARGSFLEYASKAAWWDGGKVVSPRMAAMHQQSWVQAFTHERGPGLRQLEEKCRALALPLPVASGMPLVWRFFATEEAARERLAGARARVDLFERLWPSVPASHPAVDQVLSDLMHRLPEAPVRPRPLWELIDFLQRPLVRRRLPEDRAFRTAVDALRASMLRERFAGEPELTLEAVVELLDASGAFFDDRSLSVLREQLRDSSVSASLCAQLLVSAMRMQNDALSRLAFENLPSARRREALEVALERIKQEPESAQAERKALLFESAQRMARALDDFETLMAVAELRGDRESGFQAAIQHALSMQPRDVASALTPLLTRAEPALRLRWALESDTPPAVAAYAAEVGAAAAQELGLSGKALIDRAEASANGARVLRLWLSSTATSATDLEILPPEQVLMLLRIVLGESRPDESLMERLVDAIPSSRLLSPELRPLLLKGTTRPPRAIVVRLGLAWVGAVARGELVPADAAKWLGLAPLQHWLRDTAGTADFRDKLREPGAFAHLMAAFRTWIEAFPSSDCYWILSIVRPLFRDATGSELDASALDAQTIVAHLMSRTNDVAFASLILDAVKRRHPASGWRLVEPTFMRVYSEGLKKEPAPLSFIRSLITGSDWDKAKPLRHWLLDAYVDNQWPAESLLRTLKGETELFYRLAQRAFRSREGAAYLRGLPDALTADPSLQSTWRWPVEQAFRHPRDLTDYD
jgi:hypothetical protein